MKVNPATLATQLRTWQAQGWTQRQMAAALGCHHSTVSTWMHRLGIPPADKRRAAFERAHGPGALTRLLNLLQAGVCYREIGAQYGLTRQRVHQLARQWGLPRRQVGRRLPNMRDRG